MKRSKVLAIASIIFFIFSFAACSQSQEQPEVTTTTSAQVTTQAVTTTKQQTSATVTTAATTTQKVEENPFAEFYEISWLYGMCADYVEGAWDELLLEERYNIDLKIWNINHTDTEGLSMMIAAGEIPDVGLLSNSPLTPAQLYDEGFTRSVPLSMIQHYFPHYYEKMLQNQPTSFQYNRIKDTDEYYGLSAINVTYLRSYNVPLMRLDWLENVGYEIPEEELTKITMTDERYGKFDGQLYITNYLFEHEEMNDIFRAFTEDDPDGNGEDDTYAAVAFAHSSRNHWWDLYWGQFGIIGSDLNWLYLDDASGNVVPFYAYTGWRDYMIWASNMYEKGYMRTLGEGNWRDVMATTWMTGKVGYFNADRQVIARPDLPETSDKQPPQSIWLNTDPTATFVIFPCLKGPGENYGTRRYEMTAMSEAKNRVYTFAATVSDGKLARVFTMWNDISSDTYGEFSEKILNGIEKIHYTWSGEPYNSSRMVTEATKIPPQYRKGGFWGGNFIGEENFFVYEAHRQILIFQYENMWVDNYMVEPYKYIAPLDMGQELYDAYMKDYNELNNEIMTVVNNFANRVWRGQVGDIYTEWEQYLTQLYSAGLQTMVDKYYNNDAFQKYEVPDFETIVSNFQYFKNK
jgi:putative aldouronate transport system substrate-binding protein